MKIYRIAAKQLKNTYDIYAISGGNKVFISKVNAFSEAQAIKFIENNHRVIDYKRMGWTIIASLDEEKAKRRKENKAAEEKNIQEMWWNKD